MLNMFEGVLYLVIYGSVAAVLLGIVFTILYYSKDSYDHYKFDGKRTIFFIRFIGWIIYITYAVFGCIVVTVWGEKLFGFYGAMCGLVIHSAILMTVSKISNIRQNKRDEYEKKYGYYIRRSRN